MEDPPKVIMITANEGGRHKAYAEMLGVVNYLRKPFAMEAMIEAVRNALEGADGDEKKTAKSGPLKRSKAARKKSAK